MFSVSNTTGYAILALSCLVQTRGRWVLARDVATCTGIPHPYLLKILNQLSKLSIITTKPGYRGGFQLAKQAHEITLWEIATAFDGDTLLTKCLLGLEDCCDERSCPSHNYWSKERKQIEEELKRLTLREAADFEKVKGIRLSGCLCEPGEDSIV